MLTADDARKLAQNCGYFGSLKELEDLIQDAAKRGHRGCLYKCYVSIENEAKHLRHLGYSVENSELFGGWWITW